MITSNIKTLQNSYIVCKRVKKKPFYHRSYSKVTTQDAARAYLFNNKTEADAKAKELNDKRKTGHRFRVEPADKHFLNDFAVNYNHFDKSIQVVNSLRSIQYVTERKYKVGHSINGKKQEIIFSMQKDIQDIEARIQSAQREYEAALADRKNKIVAIQKTIKDVEATNFDDLYVKPYLTKTDRTIGVLYGEKTNNAEVYETIQFNIEQGKTNEHS